MKPEDITFTQTCRWCPEQYDAYYNGKQVGYLRLRSGLFTVDCPDAGDTEVYSLEFDDNRDDFGSQKERAHYLNEAAIAICKYYENDKTGNRNA